MTSYPLASTTWTGGELDALVAVARTGQLTMGAEVEAFEKDFAGYFGTKHAVMANSGSSANLLAIASLRYHSRFRLEPGDEVIVPAVSWSTTYFPVHQYGLRLVFVDVEPGSLTLDVQQVAAAITDRTRAVFAVNLLGSAADYDRLERLCEENGILIIEDNCESMGATHRGRFTGSIGMCGTFSMFFSHHINTMEGGVVITNDDEMRDLMVSLRAHGWTRGLAMDNTIADKSPDPFLESFRFILPGYNLRPLELSAAVGRIQLPKLSDFVEVRRANAKIFQDLFQDCPDIELQQPHGESSWFGFSMLLSGSLRGRRKELVERLTENGVECRPIVSGNFVRNPVMKFLDHRIHGDLSNADWIHEDGLFVGNHHFDITTQLEHLRSLLDR